MEEYSVHLPDGLTLEELCNELDMVIYTLSLVINSDQCP